MKKLVIISNESIFEESGNFFCDNIDIKSTPEGLNKTFEVYLYGRGSKKKRAHKINLKNIYISKNFLNFFINIYQSLSEASTRYLIISVSPYTFLISLLLRIFKKKPIVYLRSDGYSEYKAILGFFGPVIYHLMFTIVSNISSLVSCRKYILKGKSGEIVSPSQLSPNWLANIKKPNLDKIKLLYIGRIRKEKGIFSLLELIKKIKIELSLSIVGAEKGFNNSISKKNINFFNIESNEEKLIEYYDNHNIFILPSFTEGHPMALLESLARQRPVIIFKDIEHVIEGKKGIFVAERNIESLLEKIEFIRKNYSSIQEEMKKNNLPTKQDFLRDLSSIISKIN
jgi:glycosyltransferase involved in cell wall biosynthesis